MKRNHASAVHVSFVMPEELKIRLVRRAAKETADSGHQITPSEIIRAAIEEYLDMWETATFVPEAVGPQAAHAEEPQEPADKQKQ